MPAKEGDIRNIRVFEWNVHLRTIGVHANERHHLIIRAFDIQLYLAMLIGYAQCFHGRLTHGDDFTLSIDSFTQ